MGRISVQVNGQRRGMSGDDGISLLSALRDEPDLRGSRFGCGQGQCGACMVLVDGRPVTACDLPAEQADGAEITTVEGLGRRHEALRGAFAEEQAAQCGYCLSGILVSAAALLDADPDPSDEAIRAALDRHLCRCGAQPRMLRAIRRAAGTR